MFPAIKAEIASRVIRVDDLLSHISGMYSGATPASVNRNAKELKGLFFVQLYGIYEYTIKHGFRIAMDTCTGHALQFAQVRKETLPLALHPRLLSVENRKKVCWRSRQDLTSLAFSNTTAVFDNSVFPSDGSHFRIQQIETIWALLGINEPSYLSPKAIGYIRELVENRNAIAHGREWPDDVGGRYTPTQLQEIKTTINEQCVFYIETLEQHVTTPANLVR